MQRYIDTDKAIEIVHKIMFEFFDYVDDDIEEPITFQDERLLEINKKICTRLKAIPAADVRENRRGEWVPKFNKWGDYVTTVDGYECSVCGEFDPMKGDNFCPYCGADMREGV